MTAVEPDTVADSVAKINGEVAVGEDLGFQRRWWRFEQIIWMFFGLLIAADVSGVFGRGPLANARMASADGSFDMHYERIERTGTPSMLTITLHRSAFTDGIATLHVTDNIVGALGAQRVIPQPATTRVGAGGLTYVFPGQDAPATIRFELQPAGPGEFPIAVGIEGRPSLTARIWVMP
jgi:hypothetical protein